MVITLEWSKEQGSKAKKKTIANIRHVVAVIARNLLKPI
jgi:hypothetical protein